MDTSVEPRRRRVRSRSSRRTALHAAAVLAAAVLLVPATALARSAAVDPYLAIGGCAMAHCDQTMSDQTGLTVPTGAVTSLWHDTSVQGSVYGLGCSSNATVAVCSFTNGFLKPTTLREYRADGTKLWSSTVLKGGTAYYSAPMVDPNGGAIAADNTKVVRFRPDGSVAWQTATPGGNPISPVITDDAAIVLATEKGPVSAYDAATGALIAKLSISDTLTIGGIATTGIFDTVNTPAVNGNRIYVSTQFRDSAGKVRPYGRLYALDLDRAAGTLTAAWHYDFQAPSGTSPTLAFPGGVPTIFFDGSGPTAGGSGKPQIFAVRDLGDHPELAWKFQMSSLPQASPALDPRGGVWVFSPYSPTLSRLDLATGAVLQTINVDTVVNQSGVHVPSSAMTMSGTPANPVMTISATPALTQNSYIVAIDLNTGKALWEVRVDQSKGLSGVSFGQFPIAQRADGRPVVIFTTFGNGTWGLGAP
jgi:outer membrane protein assembly factor BamB